LRAIIGADDPPACEARGRDPDQIEVSCSINVLVLPDAAPTRALADTIAAATGWSDRPPWD
jgi:alkanesulfonate monooxygenase SsuD/methylene tetrahydromethanopterin reductase-like flavin-dependent oxidoreductase (luciferase family)